MKTIIYALVILFCLGTYKIGNAQSLKEQIVLPTQIDSISYAMGADLANQLRTLGVTINPQMLLKGLNDLSSISEEELLASYTIIRNFSSELITRQGNPFTDKDTSSVNIDSLSYSIGLDYQKRLQGAGLELNTQGVFDGSVATLDSISVLDSEQVQNQMRTLSKLMKEKEAAKAKIIGEKNTAEGTIFLAENGKKEGVKTTASGLQYKVITAGSGASPTVANTVEVHYEGKLLDGTIFDSSIRRGESIEFPLANVIEGWTEGVQLMKKGSKFQFYIPANLGYGEGGSPPNIGPNATLIFDIELISF